MRMLNFYQADCSVELEEDEIVSLFAGPFTYISNNITYGLFLDQTKLGSSDTVNFDDASNSSGTISYCTKLITKTSSNLEVGSKKLKFNIRFDLSDLEFTLDDINIQEEDGEEINLDIEFSASACECNVLFECVSDVYIQSDSAPEFRVCITPSGENIFVSNMELILESNSYEYQPVSLGESGPIVDPITSLSQSNTVMMVTTRIVTELFNGDDSFITVKGMAFLSTGQNERPNNRNKRSNFEEIKLQVQVKKNQTESDEETRGCFDFLKAVLKWF